jgi:hypothetical protein
MGTFYFFGCDESISSQSLGWKGWARRPVAMVPFFWSGKAHSQW